VTRALRWANALRLALLLCVMSSACLPRGDAPAGRQILADKTAVLTAVLPARPDGLVRVLFFRPGKDLDNVDLWLLNADPNGGPSTEKKLFTDIDTGLELGYRPTASMGGYPVDPDGGVSYSRFVPGADPTQLFTIDVMRADPVTWEVVDLGMPPNVAMPPTHGQDPTLINYLGAPLNFPANGGVTVPDVASYGFAGTTAFYLTNGGTLFSLDTTGMARQLSVGVATFLALSAQTVLITRAVMTPDTGQPPPSDPFGGPPGPPARVTGALLDTTTLVETPLPDGLLYQYASRPSPSGRWLIVYQESQDPTERYGSVAELLDTATGTIEALEPAFSNSGAWRPGHDELWSTFLDDPQHAVLPSQASLLIKKPGIVTVTVPGVYFTRFSSDGASYFMRGSPLDAQESSDLVGLADDPAGPRFAAVPAGSSLVNTWPAGDGRVLDEATAGLDNFESSYVQFVDPHNGAAQLVGERGVLSAVGTTRALGIYHVSFLRGDLTTTDFATGRSTVLAAEFAEAAVAEPQGADPYPPGGRIVYQFVSHFDSPWNGLWMANVP